MNIDLKTLLKTGNFPSILLLYGDEEFLVEDAYNSIIAKLITSESDKFNFDIFDCDDKTVTQQQVVECCSAYPMMSEQRVVVLKHFEDLFPLKTGKKKDLENSPFVKYAANPAKTTKLIIRADIPSFAGLTKDLSGNKEKANKKISGAKIPYNLLFANHSWIEFPKIWENQQMSWASARFKQLGYEISQEAVFLLINQTNPDLRSIANAIEQLTIYADSKKSINIDDVNQLSGHSRSYNVFELQKAVGNRDLSSALNIMNNILKVSRDEIAIVSILTRFIIQLWKLYEAQKQNAGNAQIASALGVNPYFIAEYVKAGKLYNAVDLNRAFLALTAADLALKSTTIDRFVILQEMLIKIMAR
jgi:DNA polymerase-3 subunit delta